jgi:hypothetical protein
MDLTASVVSGRRHRFHKSCGVSQKFASRACRQAAQYQTGMTSGARLSPGLASQSQNLTSDQPSSSKRVAKWLTGVSSLMSPRVKRMGEQASKATGNSSARRGRHMQRN